MHIIVAGAMHDEQFAPQPFGEVDRRSAAVALRILVRQSHVSFLIDDVIELLIGHRRDGHSRTKQVRGPEHQIQRVRPAAAPAPDAHPGQIDIGPLSRQSQYRFGLFLRRKHAHGTVDRLPPGAAPIGAGVPRLSKLAIR